MQQSDGLMKIGDFARFADTNLRTLRYYEELGLMEPATRSAGGFRYYRRTDVNRVKFIRDLQDLGLQLEQIREFIAARDEKVDRAALMARIRHALEEHERLIDERIRLLEEQRDRVREARAKLSQCADCCHTQPNDENNHCEPCPMTGLALPDLLSALF